MRATRAYIASAGTAAVMLGAAVAMLALVSAFVAFGSWPGQGAGSEVDQVLLNEVVGAKPKAVAVREDAVKVARRTETRRQAAAKRRQGNDRTVARAPDGTPVAKLPAGATPTGGGGTTSTPGATDSPASTVQQQTQNVTQNIQDTTRNVGTQVQQQVDQTTTQVNEVVDQVVGGVQQQTDTTVQQVGDTVDTTVGTVDDTVGGVKDTVGGVLGK